MRESCPRCGFSYTREPGFYLGSIYLNYGATVILTGGLYAILVLGMGFSTETALAACLAAAVLFPILFFRHARSFLLALDSSVNQDQTGQTQTGQTQTDKDHIDEHPARDADDTAAAPPAGGLTRHKLAALASDDGRAGCAMGVALALILLFGLGMAAVTLLFMGDGGMNAPFE